MKKILIGGRRSGKTTRLLGEAIDTLLVDNTTQLYVCFQPEQVLMIARDILTGRGIQKFTLHLSRKELSVGRSAMYFVTPDELHRRPRGFVSPTKITYDINWPLAWFPYHITDIAISLDDDWEFERL